MEFAKQQLLKYGWTEGKGLGKNEDGISQAIKPKLKFDSTGVGHDSSEQFTYNWWENVYNNAADNINVKKLKNGEVSVGLKCEDSVDITTKKYSLKRLNKNKKMLEYGSFLKVSKLTADGVLDHEDKVATSADLTQPLKVINLTDDELLAACGGRTAHKGARHGLKLNGKLARIDKQEKLLMMHYQQKKYKEDKRTEKDGSNISDEHKLEKNKKKKKKKPEMDVIEPEKSPAIKISNEAEKSTKKRKHKEHKDAFIDAEIAEKRYEYERFKQERKKLKIKKRRQEKELSKISNMLEQCKIENFTEASDDDGFEEGTKKKIKLMVNNEDKKSRKKKKKNVTETTEKHCEDDDGFEELVTKIDNKVEEIRTSFVKYKKQKKILEDKKISEISNDLKKICTV